MERDWSGWEPRIAAWALEQLAAADAAHDAEHLRRVVRQARALAAVEGADPAIVVPAAWLHDCVAVPKDSPERTRASRLAAAAAIRFLASIEYPASYHAAIAHAIEAHSFSAKIAPRTVEARVVQDADRLDALGAIGTARCLLLGGAMGKPFYAAGDPFAAERQPDDTRYVLDHFWVKLLGLAATMTTAAGRAEAERRVGWMQGFLAQLRAEVGAAGGG